jgi:hypothetical protein
MPKRRVLRVLKERKLADLLDPPRPGAVFEASGVIVNSNHCFVALDNVRRVARIGTDLRLDSDDHRGSARIDTAKAKKRSHIIEVPDGSRRSNFAGGITSSRCVRGTSAATAGRKGSAARDAFTYSSAAAACGIQSPASSCRDMRRSRISQGWRFAATVSPWYRRNRRGCGSVDCGRRHGRSPVMAASSTFHERRKVRHA